VTDKVIGDFAAFIDRKSRVAITTELPPSTTELERPLNGMLAIGSPWTERLFDGPFYLYPPAATAQEAPRPSRRVTRERTDDAIESSKPSSASAQPRTLRASLALLHGFGRRLVATL
jgi:hypothetical protein